LRAGGGLRLKSKTLALLVAVSLGAGLLSATVALPVVGVVGVVAKDTATTFNDLPVAHLGLLPARSELLDTSGRVIAYYYPRNIYRVPVTYHEIAPVMRNAIVSIEDERFWQHGALDLRGMIRAVTTTLSGTGTQGGSDLAQQFVKNACLLTATTSAQVDGCKAETVTRKIRELRAAINVLHHMTRPQLLAAYLNVAYFENQTYGIQVASKFYFSTSAGDLSLDQAALLAGLVQNPAAYDPLVNPKAALARRNVVLAKMALLGYISRARQQRAAAAPLGLHVSPVPLQTGCVSPQDSATDGFFCDYVLSVMRHDPTYAKVWAALNFSGGLKIYTTMNSRDQLAADRAVNWVVPSRNNYYNPGHNVDTEVLIQPGTGYIRAIAVDRPFGNGPGQTTIDYAVNTEYGSSAGVQTGSSSKVFTLVTALKEGLPFGYHLRVVSPTVVSGYTNCQGGYVKPFPVINAEGRQGAATYTLYQGTVESINAFYATLEQRVGLCDVVKTAVSLGMTRADGVSLLRRDPNLAYGHRESVDNIPSFTLGSVNVSPMNMAAAYATLAARGRYCKPIAIKAIIGPGGKQLAVEPMSCHQAISKAVADAANYVLQGVLGPSGTGYNRGIGIPAAAKTGTSNDGYYAAFAGYTPRLTGYVSVFNPRYPITVGRMLGYRADYREVNGQLAVPFQMFGDNAPGATWQMTFLRLHLAPESFVAPPPYPFFDLPLVYVPPHKPKPSPTGSPSPGPSPSRSP
jgi:membrane peptidoglycan carboxypeptidase